MNYSGIIYDDVANGTGIRTSLFVSGCRNNCIGCFNKEQQDFNYGEEFTKEIEDSIIKSVDDPFHAGITILGGDPMEPENAERLVEFVQNFRDRYFKSKTIWLYTGYIYENLLSLDDSDPRKQLLSMIDIIVDGPFIEAKKSLKLKFKGSSNQRIMDISGTKPSIIG